MPFGTRKLWGTTDGSGETKGKVGLYQVLGRVVLNKSSLENEFEMVAVSALAAKGGSYLVARAARARPSFPYVREVKFLCARCPHRSEGAVRERERPLQGFPTPL